MAHRHEPEVLIAGAGPVGLFAALRLARAGVPVQIVDRERDVAAHSYALALHPRSLALLDEVGLAAEVRRLGLHVDRVAFYEGWQRRVELAMSWLPTLFPEVVVLPQNVLEDLLLQALIERRVPVLWNHRLSDLGPQADGVHVAVDRLGATSTGYAVAGTEWVVEKRSETLVRYVLGADGHDSFVRRRMGIDYRQVGEPSLYAVFEFAVDGPIVDEVRVVFHEGTTSVLWPLPGGRCRWSFEVHDSGEILQRRSKNRLAVQVSGKSYPFLDASHLAAFLSERAPWFAGTPADVTWSMMVRFEKRIADAFGRGRTWLAGDAAHMTMPAGVQSMNVGLREAADLADGMATLLGGGGPEDVLEACGRRYAAEWSWLLGLERPGGPAGTDAWVEPARILSCIPASGEDLTLLVRRLRGEVVPS